MKQGTVALLVVVALLAGAGLTWWYLRKAGSRGFDEGGVEGTCANSATNKCNGIYMVDASVPKCDVDLPVVTLHLTRQPQSITWYPHDSYQYQVRFANSPFPSGDAPPYSVGPALSQHMRDPNAPQHYFAYSIEYYNSSAKKWQECKSDRGDPRDDDPGIKIRN